jgi:hypothetical protein
MKRNIASRVSIVLAATLFPFIAPPPAPGFGQNQEGDGKLILDNNKIKLKNLMAFWRANLAVGPGGGYASTNATSLVEGRFESYLYRVSMYSVEPSVGLGFNLLGWWWRLYVDLGYRYMGPTDDLIKVNDDSVTVNMSFGFGRYRDKERAKGQ